MRLDVPFSADTFRGSEIEGNVTDVIEIGERYSQSVGVGRSSSSTELISMTTKQIIVLGSDGK